MTWLVHRRLRLTILTLAVLGLAASGAHAESLQNDAGSGRDAGDTRAKALKLTRLGAFTGNLTSDDTDWYRHDASTETPRCVRAQLSPSFNARLRLVAVSPERDQVVDQPVSAGGARALGIAVNALQRDFVNVSPSDTDDLGAYDFVLEENELPEDDSGDALTGNDAGDTLASALPVPKSCFGGKFQRLLGTIDTEDVYAVGVNAGDTIVYSLAAQASNITLRVLDPSGIAIGPSIEPGDMAGVYVETTDTYYIAASQSSSEDDVGYLIGLAIGPDPPTSGCRPNCML